MRLIRDEVLNKIVADEGKHIRDIKDVYVSEYIDEQGNVVPEHYPYYTITLCVPNGFTEEQMNELYIEEEVK